MVDEAGSTYRPDPEYRQTWARRARYAVLAALALLVAAVVLLVVGQPGPAIAAVLVAAVLGGPALITRTGNAQLGRHRYELVVRPDRLTIVWRDEVTHLPWVDLEYAQVVDVNAQRTLEVRPGPGGRPVLPRGARPRPSRYHRGNLEVFILSWLGARQPDCIADVAGHLELR
jgi:hypothetical protein